MAPLLTKFIVLKVILSLEEPLLLRTSIFKV